MLIISPDEYRYDDKGKYDGSPEGLYKGWAESFEHLGEFLRSEIHRTAGRKAIILMGVPGAGKTTWLKDNMHRFPDVSVCIDATHTTEKDRCAPLHFLKAFNFEVIAVWVYASIQTCLKRNAPRTPDRKVPLNVIEKKDKEFEIPKFLEGFSEIVTVNNS